MKVPKVLMVDDDRQFSLMTKEYLEMKQLHIDLVHSGDAGLTQFTKAKYDLCILDIRMPMKDGYTLAAEIRSIQSDIPIIFLTGLHEREDKIKGLAMGADDYITKPFSVEELSLRIQNILRRSGYQNDQKQKLADLSIGIYQFNPVSRELVGPSGLAKLTSIESQLLNMFYDNLNQVLSRDAALRKIWGDEHFLHGRSLNVYVSKLRSFLKDDVNIEILNVHGIGYKMVLRS
jgi:two-component system OmpR family response regulator